MHADSNCENGKGTYGKHVQTHFEFGKQEYKCPKCTDKTRQKEKVQNREVINGDAFSD